MLFNDKKTLELTCGYVRELVAQMEKRGNLPTAVKMFGDMAFRLWIDLGNEIREEEKKANGIKDAEDNF